MMSENERPEHEAAIDAMEKFQARVTIPMLYDRGGVIDVVGSGVLFSHAERHFVITAAHIFDPEFHVDDIRSVGTPIVRTRALPRSFGAIV
jgi:hypothetical protein